MDTSEALKQQWEQEHVALLREIMEANKDLDERVAQLGLFAYFDEIDDVAVVHVGPPVEAMTESVHNTLLIRVDPETLKIVGMEVMGFRRLLQERPPELAAFISAFEFAADSVAGQRVTDPAVAKDVTTAMRELVHT